MPTSTGFLFGLQEIDPAQRMLSSIGFSTAPERLGRFPHMGHLGRAPGTLEWLVPGLPYIVVYRIDDDADVIDVISVFHGAQDLDL